MYHELTYVIRGYCTANQKNSKCCVLISKLSTLLGKMIYTSYGKLSKEPKNSDKI